MALYLETKINVMEWNVTKDPMYAMVAVYVSYDCYDCYAGGVSVGLFCD